MRLLILTLLLCLTSCLSKGQGEGISDPEAASTPATGGVINYSAIEFAGLASVETVNDSQIKVSFDGAMGGSGIFNYRLFLASNMNSIFRSYGLGQYDVDPSTGKYFVIVSGLSPLSSYSFTLRAHDIMQSKADENTVVKTATTVAAMAPFAGITTVTDITTTSMKLNWPFISAASRYEVYKVENGQTTYLTTVPSSQTSFTVRGLLPSTSYTYRVNYRTTSNIIDQNSNNRTTSTLGVVPFSGASSVTNPTTTSLQVNWAPISAATSYIIYRIDGGGNLFPVGTVSALTNYYRVTGLSTGAAYSFVVRYQDSNGAIDTNTNIASGATVSVSVNHQGWTTIFSVGPRVDFRGITMDPGNMKLGWAPFTASAGVSVLGYNLYSSTTPNGSFTNLVNTSGVIPYSSSNIIYSIPNISTLYQPGTAYYFKLTAIVTGSVELPANPTTPVDHTVIKVIYPQQNMSLVHRWAANLDVCTKMGRGLNANLGVEINNHYRCEFNGYGHVVAGGVKFYDLGHDLLVDIGEIGCNFTRGSACTSQSVGGVTTTDCIGDNVPGTGIKAAKKTVFFNRYSGGQGCYVQTSDDAQNPVWTLITNLTAADLGPAGVNYGLAAVSNTNRLPAISRLTQTQAFAACQSQNTVIQDSGLNYDYQKRLLRRKEFVAASSWPEGMSPQDEQNVERNIIPNGCAYWNDTVRGASYALNYGNDGYHNYDANGTIPLVAGGVTSSCKSRYGLQDMSGSMAEWVSDQFKCSGEQCTFADLPLIDPQSRENWKNGTGEYFTAVGHNSDRSNAVMSLFNGAYSWFNDGNWSRFLHVPLGIPLQCNGTSCGGGTDDNTISTVVSTGASLKALPDFSKGGSLSGNKIMSIVSSGFQNYDNTYTEFRTGRLSFYTVDISGEFNPLTMGGRCAAPVSYSN